MSRKLLLLMLVLLSVTATAAAQTTPRKKPHKAKTAAVQPAPEPAPAPVPPPPPLTPEQGPSSPPEVSFKGGELTIVARNSTMGDVLTAVKQRTGAAVDMPVVTSERIVGRFGPGAPQQEPGPKGQVVKTREQLLRELQQQQQQQQQNGPPPGAPPQ